MKYVLLLSLTLMLPGVAWAKGPGGFKMHRGPSPDQFLEQHAERLNLDEETLNKIRAIADASKEEGERLHEQAREAKRTLRDLLSQDAPDEKAVMHQVEILGERKTAIRKHRLKILLQIRTLLTPEQRTELQAIHQEMRSQKGRGHRPPY